MYFVPPNAGECFYLCVLLTVVTGLTSFEHLRTYEGVVYDTFKGACLARGLLEDDSEWRQCLLEATIMQTGQCLCSLFATLLLFCDPADPVQLWTDFREHICNDLRHRLQALHIPNPSEDNIFDYGLFLLDSILAESGRYLKEWPAMPQPLGQWQLCYENALLSEQLSYDTSFEREQADKYVSLLNDGQQSAFNTIIKSVSDNHGKLFFLHGAGGTGKTFVYNTICL